MNKNYTGEDFKYDWPDLNIGKNKSTNSERRMKYQNFSKATNSPLKSQERNINNKLQKNINTSQINKPWCSSQRSNEDRKKLSTPTKHQASIDIGPNPKNEQNMKVPPNKSSVVVDICEYWNKIEEFNKHYYQNYQNLPQNNDLNFYSFVTEAKPLQQTETASSETREPLTREEITLQRKLKVAARRQMMKQEKQQLKAIVSGVQAAKPDFSLEQATEDFPALNSGKKVKKVKKVTNVPSFKSESETQNVEKDKSAKPLDKSWKPKIKDPININISQVLQTIKSEKPKPVVKKPNPSNQRSVVGGNMLDSDNPERKKGKVRPDKVPRPSKLKSLILSERNKRQQKRLGEVEEPPLPKETDQPTLIKETNFKIGEDRENDPALEEENLENKLNVICYLQGIHSRKFRDYCTNCLTEELTVNVCTLLEKLAQFQDRTFAQNPIKANAKRRYVAGINQTNKYLLVKKVKLLVIAPDLEKNPGKGGLDEKIQNFVTEAQSQGIPCVFGPNRKRLGKAVIKNTLVSCVAVLNYDGAQDLFLKVQEALNEAKLKYQDLVNKFRESVPEKEEVLISPVAEEKSSTDEITSAFLATLRGEVTPADKLLRAIEGCAW